MMMIDRRNKRSVQIFLLLITFLVCSGIFFWVYSHPEDYVPDYFPPEVKENQKTEREIALEKVRELQKNGFENGASETFYDESKKSLPGNSDNSGYENARVLFKKLNSTAVQENPELVNENNGERMTADAFYDEKLKQKQKQEEDMDKKQQSTQEKKEDIRTGSPEEEQQKLSENQIVPKNDETTIIDDENSFDAISRNDTASLDIIGKSEAVQSWLAKKQEPQKPLSEVESSLHVDEAAQLSARRNPKFEIVVDPEIERLQNQVHQFKFMQ